MSQISNSLRDRLPFPPRTEPQFHWRGHEVTRLEGFTDAVFAFAVTLLIVALEVPHTFEGLLDVLRGFPAFVICFAILMTFWNAHYKFFRRYGLQNLFSRVITMAIIVLVFMVYRDLRAVVACCLPLTVGTFIGYWFMKELQIGLTVATLPVMVLAVGIGVDYAFYIYNRLLVHLAGGQTIVQAIERAILEVGTATIFTAITLAIGVATWSFSQLKFQADMGKLLAFMFMVNMVMAMTALPAVAVWLERLFPRKTPVRATGLQHH